MPPNTGKPYSDHPGFSWRELSFSLQLCFLVHLNSSTVTALIPFQTILVWAAAENPSYHLPREFNNFSLCVYVPVSLSLSHICMHKHTLTSALPTWPLTLHRTGWNITEIHMCIVNGILYWNRNHRMGNADHRHGQFGFRVLVGRLECVTQTTNMGKWQKHDTC